MDHLNDSGRYRCAYVNVEIAQAAREQVAPAIRAILGELGSWARDLLQDGFVDEIWPEVLERYGPYAAFGEVLSRWAAHDPERPLVLLIDEIDALNMLMAPGVTTANVIHAGITYAENRKDLMLIAEAPIHLEPLETVDFRKGQGMYSHAAFNSSYAALYYPWLEINDPVSGKRKLVPPSGAVAGCYARSDQKTYVWYAPAGIDRGRIFNALSLGYKASRGERAPDHRMCTIAPGRCLSAPFLQKVPVRRRLQVFRFY